MADGGVKKGVVHGIERRHYVTDLPTTLFEPFGLFRTLTQTARA
jgi:hypothetical protein